MIKAGQGADRMEEKILGLLVQLAEGQKQHEFQVGQLKEE